MLDVTLTGILELFLKLLSTVRRYAPHNILERWWSRTEVLSFFNVILTVKDVTGLPSYVPAKELLLIFKNNSHFHTVNEPFVLWYFLKCTSYNTNAMSLCKGVCVYSLLVKDHNAQRQIKGSEKYCSKSPSLTSQAYLTMKFYFECYLLTLHETYFGKCW